MKKSIRESIRKTLSFLPIVTIVLSSSMADAAVSGSWGKVPSQSIPSGQYTVQNNLKGISMLSTSSGWTVGWTSNPNGPAYATNTLIEQWNGLQFTIVPSPNSSNPENQLYGVSAYSPTDVWAVGYSLSPSQIKTNTLIEHWNGSAWSIIPSPSPATGYNWLKAVKAFASNNVWAVGFDENESNQGAQPPKTLVLHWDGSTWTQVSSPNPNPNGDELSAITATSPTDVWVGGLQGNGSSFTPLALHWNGSSWTSYTVPTGPGSKYGAAINGLSGTASNDVWAVGYTIGSSTFGLYAHWNGTAWSYVYPPLCSGQCRWSNDQPVYGVSEVASTNVWSVGETQGLPLIANWDGTQWNYVAPAMFGASYNVMFAVDALNASNAFAAGNYDLSGQPQQTLVEEYSAGGTTHFPGELHSGVSQNLLGSH